MGSLGNQHEVPGRLRVGDHHRAPGRSVSELRTGPHSLVDGRTELTDLPGATPDLAGSRMDLLRYYLEDRLVDISCCRQRLSGLGDGRLLRLGGVPELPGIFRQRDSLIDYGL